MGETAKALGLGQFFVHNGVKYEIAPPEYEYMGEFELYLENRALERIERQKGRIPDEVYKARHEEAVAQVAAGEFSRGSVHFQKAVNSFEGQQELAFILMKARNPEVTHKLVEEIFRERYNEVMARLLLTIQETQINEGVAENPTTPPPS